MKVAVLLALVSVAFAAPQPRKIFHEHFQDFIVVIGEEAGDELNEIVNQYYGSDEFLATIDYLKTADFKNLIYEMEDLPEFKAVQNFLDTHNIDITFFIDILNDLLENELDRKARQSASGSDFNSYIKDTIALFPQEKLAALYEQKLAEDEEFRAAIEGLQSEEFDQLFSALWESPTFQAEVQTMVDNGIDLGLLVEEVVAIFGQKLD